LVKGNDQITILPDFLVAKEISVERWSPRVPWLVPSITLDRRWLNQISDQSAVDFKDSPVTESRGSAVCNELAVRRGS
jgi:hypothetical protein